MTGVGGVEGGAVESTGARSAPGTADRETAPRHLHGLDLVRVAALLLVVAIHSDHWAYQASGAAAVFWPAFDLLCRVSVPLFVVLSGFLLAYREQESMPLPRFLRRRLGRSLLPFAFWLPVYTVIGGFLTHEVVPTPAGVWSWWALGAGHLWYLLLVPQLYLVFQVWPRSPAGAALASAPAIAVQVGLCVYRLVAPATWPLVGFLLAHGFQIAPLWIGYFGAGVLLGRRRPFHRVAAFGPRAIAVTAVALAAAAVLLLRFDGSGTTNSAYAAGTGAFLLPSLIPLTLVVFVGTAVAGDALLREGAFAEGVSSVSRYALGIYIVHEALTYLTGPLQYLPAARAHLAVAALLFLVQVAVTTALAYAVTRLLAAGRGAIVVGLPPEPLRWSRWRHPLAV